ncbi:GntR family transcriptional regulator [Streptomyces fulvoviolaceus]|uniref:GntR family transcriptional regulator n=1 Tax=Streptomyces fulvoviolaceus TaxID=285535 RepID=UPI0004C77EF8|nr:GntR family transcriptional regulator [Streptomyces fulvoviolaceus]
MSRGNGGGRELERVLGELRARIGDGRYPLNGILPSQRELAAEFDVSRDTVQRVLGELKAEGLIAIRQGVGARVIGARGVPELGSSAEHDRIVTLGTVICRAFERAEVTMDVFSLTTEALDGHLRLQAERILAQEIAPQRIAIRLLLPSESLETPYWRTEDGAHDDGLRERMLGVTRRHTAALRTLLSELDARGLVPEVDVEIRHVHIVPMFKLYLVNGVEALYGPYQVPQRSIVLDDGREIEATDVFGPGAGLTLHVKDHQPDSQGTVFVQSMQAWFDSIWEVLAR